MNTVLDKIFAQKRIRIEEQMREIPTAKMEQLAENANTRASFFNALKDGSKEHIAIIAELKKASPSLGLIRENFDVCSLASSLSKSGASALSVLAEQDFFMGDIKNINIASRNTPLPILCKDFIFCEYQILQAKANGASAVLLIVAMLDCEVLKRLLNFAHSLKLDVLVETHTPQELDIACGIGARIIGVNSRNLKTLKIDVSIFETMIAKIPQGALAVAESGILDANYLKKAHQTGAKAALVGTALMSKPNPAKELETLLKNL